MGICIHLAISDSVTKKEWDPVYKESLRMIEAFPLAEKRKVVIRGIETICLVKTREREETVGWDKEKRVGWNTIGDYKFMCTAEDYYLPRDFGYDGDSDGDYVDAMYGVLPSYLDYDWKDDKFKVTYNLWGSKTQGEPYHIYLLAIACMIESRLGPKAFVYGDITRGQCLDAVKRANEVLENPINPPARCDPERLLVRVNTLPLSDMEKIAVYEKFFLGTKDRLFRDTLTKYFSPFALNEYWKKRFSNFRVDQLGFHNVFEDYMLWGFELSELCGFVNFDNEDGQPQYEQFIEKIMGAKLHVKDKDCSDPLNIDQEESRPYSVNTYFAQFVFAGARNHKIDRYIPIGEIREALIKGIGDKCDVNGIIDRYLEQEANQKKIDITEINTEEEYLEATEQDPSAVFNQTLEMRRERMQKIRQTYDISDFDDLIFYETGDTMFHGIEVSLAKSFRFYRSILDEDHYKDLMAGPPEERCKFLVEQNRSILIRDKDWEKIFSDILEYDDSFERYYPMVRVRIVDDDIGHMIKGIVLNDALYNHCFELADKYGDEEIEE